MIPPFAVLFSCVLQLEKMNAAAKKRAVSFKVFIG
jgi:hypothetical protein